MLHGELIVAGRIGPDERFAFRCRSCVPLSYAGRKPPETCLIQLSERREGDYEGARRMLVSQNPHCHLRMSLVLSSQARFQGRVGTEGLPRMGKGEAKPAVPDGVSIQGEPGTLGVCDRRVGALGDQLPRCRPGPEKQECQGAMPKSRTSQLSSRQSAMQRRTRCRLTNRA
jgi:hypothetical protein